jgi:hypothetical protein
VIIAILGWILAAWGAVASISLIIRFNELTDFDSLGLPDFVQMTWPGFVLVGAGATVAALGHLLSVSQRGS